MASKILPSGIGLHGESLGCLMGRNRPFRTEFDRQILALAGSEAFAESHSLM